MGTNIEDKSGMRCCVGEDEGLVDMTLYGLMVKRGGEGELRENGEVDETDGRKICIAGKSTMLPESKLMSVREIEKFFKKAPSRKVS